MGTHAELMAASGLYARIFRPSFHVDAVPNGARR